MKNEFDTEYSVEKSVEQDVMLARRGILILILICAVMFGAVLLTYIFGAGSV